VILDPLVYILLPVVKVAVHVEGVDNTAYLDGELIGENAPARKESNLRRGSTQFENTERVVSSFTHCTIQTVPMSILSNFLSPTVQYKRVPMSKLSNFHCAIVLD